MPSEEGCHLLRIASLHEDRAWSCEFTHKTFTSGKATDQATRSRSLNDILTVPSDQVSIVNDILLICLQLQVVSNRSRLGSRTCLHLCE